jgi:hypothetical protein
MAYFKVVQKEVIVREFFVRADSDNEANFVGWNECEPEYSEQDDPGLTEVQVFEMGGGETVSEISDDTYFFDCECDEWTTRNKLLLAEVEQ